MKNFEIIVNGEQARAARNVLKYHGNISDCLQATSPCSWVTNLDERCCYVFHTPANKIKALFLNEVKQALKMANVTDYRIVDVNE